MQNDISPSLDASGFEELSRIAYAEAGLVLASSKAAMIQSRLRHRLKQLNLSSLHDYCKHIESPNGKSEKDHMISALTTNVSSFFREPHHFELLKEQHLPRLERKAKSGLPIRIWSAGCSNGQEPYSLAMMLKQECPTLAKSDCKILATDIDHAVLTFAAQGIYDEAQVGDINEELLSKYFTGGSGTSGHDFKVDDSIRELVTFKRLNLHADWPMKGKFDIIFCRNVVIYFDAETQDRLWPKFKNALDDEGILFVGHSERVSCESFVSVGATAYQKATQNVH